MNYDEIRDVSDIVELEYIQRIQDAIGNLTGITTAVLDPNGVPVTRATNLHAFCEMMQASEDGIKLCMRTNNQLIEINKETRHTATVVCPNSGLQTAAVPIFLGKKYLGAFLVGQLKTKEIDYELIEKTAKNAGISVEEAKRNMDMLPTISEEEFQNILRVLEVITDVVVRLVNTNNEIMEKNVELTELTEKLNNSAHTFREFIDLTDVGAYLIDFETGELLLYNNVYLNLIGKKSAEVEGQSCYNMLGYEDWCLFCPRDLLLNKNGEPGDPYVWENYLDRRDIWLRITSRAIRWIDGRLAQMVTFLDITERKKQEEELAYIAYYDQRLNIPNGMRLFLDSSASHESEPYLICFDILGLRKINDVYGRDSGDRLLAVITDWIQAQGHAGRPIGVYRIDGDEFAVTEREGGLEKARELAQKIWDRFEHPWDVDMGEARHTIFARLSMGIIPIREGFESYASMVNSVERILETARDQNHFIVYDTKIDEDFRQHLLMEINLKKCVLNDMEGFYLHYQPIVDQNSEKWVGMEALCRWNSPVFGEISPVIFIPEAEQLGLINILGEWVLREAIRQVTEWGLNEVDGFVLDVNLSPIQLGDPQLGERFSDIIRAAGYPPEKLSLEVTESAEVHFDDHIMHSLERLRKTGIALSLDDFGTGYASYSSLNNLPISIIKTDRSFVQNLEAEEYLQSTFQIMVEFAHAAGLRVIAEGVETKEQVKILSRLGVDLFQGYYFSRPLSVADIEKNLSKYGI